MTTPKALFLANDGVLEEFSIYGDQRENVSLLGTCDGINRDFLLPEPAIHNPPQNVVKVYHGGRRLNAYEYEVLESVPGSGNLDLVHLTRWAPSSDNRLVADYYAA